MQSDNSDHETRKTFPIGYVALATGLSPHVIRVWERRYRAVAPEREGKKRRLYSQEDIEHLQLLKQARQRGHRIGSVAKLDEGALHRLEGSEQIGFDSNGSDRNLGRVAQNPPRLLSACESAVRQMDAPALMRALQRADRELSRTVLLTGVIGPLMHWIGDGWSAKRLGIMHEHFASNVVRMFLADLLSRGQPNQDAPRMVVATPSGQHCEIGAMTAAVAAADRGWRVFYFGPDLPCDDVAAAAASKRAGAVCLSITCRNQGKKAGLELHRLQQQIGNDVRVLIGGQAADAYRQGVASSNFRVFSSLPEFIGFISHPETAQATLAATGGGSHQGGST